MLPRPAKTAWIGYRLLFIYACFRSEIESSNARAVTYREVVARSAILTSLESWVLTIRPIPGERAHPRAHRRAHYGPPAPPRRPPHRLGPSATMTYGAPAPPGASLSAASLAARRRARRRARMRGGSASTCQIRKVDLRPPASTPGASLSARVTLWGHANSRARAHKYVYISN